MTMLDRMRRHKSWLKWSLGIVVATFIALYVPSFLKGGGVGAAPSDAIATVNGLDIPVSTYQRVYQQQVDQLRQAYGSNFNDQMLKQLGISQRIIQQLVDEEAVLAEAERLGLSASDAELRERIVRDPRFQQNGQFVGYDTYVQMLMSAAAADPAVGFRGLAARRAHHREAAERRHRLGPRGRRGRGRRVPQAQREGEDRSGDLHVEPVPHGHQSRPTPNCRRSLRRTLRRTRSRKSGGSSSSRSTRRRSRAR